MFLLLLFFKLKSLKSSIDPIDTTNFLQWVLAKLGLYLHWAKNSFITQTSMVQLTPSGANELDENFKGLFLSFVIRCGTGVTVDLKEKSTCMSSVICFHVLGDPLMAIACHVWSLLSGFELVCSFLLLLILRTCLD